MATTATQASAKQADDINAAPTRLFSLDALRGFDMFWIMGGEEIFHGMAKATGSPFWGAIANQFTHPDWNGFHLYDLIFPLFLFMAGVSTPFSVGRELEKGKTKQQLLFRVIKRALILVLLGLVVNNGLKIMPISQIRFPSVLGRIGIAYQQHIGLQFRQQVLVQGARVQCPAGCDKVDVLAGAVARHDDIHQL